MPREFDRTIAFIAGSGLAQGLECILEDRSHHTNIVMPHPFAPVLSYYEGFYGRTRIIILPRHGDATKNTPARSPAELVSMLGYEGNIWFLHQQGVNAVYGFSAGGALDLDMPLADAGVFLVPHNYIGVLNHDKGKAHSFGHLAKVVHAPQHDTFDPELRQRAMQAIARAGLQFRDKGVYLYNNEDVFESAAEIELLERATRLLKYLQDVPAHEFPAYFRYVTTAPLAELTEVQRLDRVVGMTTVPELILLSQMQIPFAVVFSNVNYAEGLSKATIVSHEQTLAVMGRAEAYIINIVKEIIRGYEQPSP